MLSTAWVKTKSAVAADAVVREGQQVGPYHLGTRILARFRKNLSHVIEEQFEIPAYIYPDLAKEHARAICSRG